MRVAGMLCYLFEIDFRVTLISRSVLGLNGLQGPSRLVRVLLADPLAPEQRWEQQLDFPVDDDGRGILIRYVHVEIGSEVI